MAVSILAVSFALFLIGSLKLFSLRHLFLFFFLRCLCLKYSESDDSDESDEEESDKFGSESESAGPFGTELGGLLRDVGLPSGVTISADDSRDGDRGSLV